MMLAAVLVFISYSHRDLVAAADIAQRMRTAGCSVWMDASIEGGEDWRARVETEIDRASVVVVVLSKDSAKSRDVADEIAYARNAGKRVVPVRIDKARVPLALARLQWLSAEESGKVCKP